MDRLLRMGLAVVALVASAGSCARREPPHKVILVGLDGADWELLDAYMADGTMPNLASLVREGRSGVLTTLEPPLSPLVWTSMMTGAGPLEHGILDFTRFHPGTGEREPITSDERRVPAVWTLASAAGRTVAVFGMWATWPAETVRGTVVSDRLVSFQRKETGSLERVTFPTEAGAGARKMLAKVEAATGAAAMRAYLPDTAGSTGADLDLGWETPSGALRRILVETRTYDALAREAVDRLHPDLVVLYIQGTDAVGHVFGPFVAPALPGVDPAEAARYGDVPRRYHREVDGILGAWRELAAREGAVLLLASDHGFQWGEHRPAGLASTEAASAGRWHRERGIWVLWGPGVGTAPRSAEGEVRQVAPTLLALLGVAPTPGMPPPLPGAPPALVPVMRETSVAAAEGGTSDPKALAKLRALGYVGSAEPQRRPASADDEAPTRTPGAWNNAGLLLRQTGRREEAQHAFERAAALDPGAASPRSNLSALLFDEARDPERSDALLVESARLGLPEGQRALAARADAWRRAGRQDRAAALLERGVEVFPRSGDLWVRLGRFRLEASQCRSALAAFDRAAALAPDAALVHASRGTALVCLGEERLARAAFRLSLSLDPNQPELLQSLPH